MVLFVVDTQAGLAPLDQEVARRLRYIDKPIICVANKTDSDAVTSQADEFYRLGRGKLICCSTKANRNRQQLLDMIRRATATAIWKIKTLLKSRRLKVAIVGRRNVGKSTFVNTLAKADRMIVSEVPGTTRDSVDVRFELDGKVFTAIDTPGLTEVQERAYQH